MKILVFMISFFSTIVHANVMDDIYNNLDFTSFPTSLNPKRIDEKKLPDFRGREHMEYLLNPKITQDEIVMEGDSWFYKFKLLDEWNGDLYLCVWDKSKGGSYDARYPIVIRKYNTTYVALALDPTPLEGGCDRLAK
ncbi:MULTISPECIES: hypothetical protein [Vibrio]|nr:MULTISPECIES: hypothetical protein [Vibrio]PTO72699.1 hypothetical protein CWN81_12515 [Vibrio splendidus]PTP28191.1 hypothetical protein CWN95_22885 [Vibrio splendidus]PTP75724.1 hypothetical protein CWO00_12560 [Vibrio splendidus]